MTIRDRLRQEKHGKVASATKLARPYIQQVAAGVRTPSVRTIVALADFFGSSNEEIGASVREWAGVHASNDNLSPIHMESAEGESGVAS